MSAARLVDDGEADAGGGRQGLGEVLHHALQPRRALEGGAALVGVLGVYELADHAARALQRLHVRAHGQHQLVDVACIGTLSLESMFFLLPFNYQPLRAALYVVRPNASTSCLRISAFSLYFIFTLFVLCSVKFQPSQAILILSLRRALVVYLPAAPFSWTYTF